MKTYSIAAKDIEKKWYLVDAENLVLGRMASEIAKILRGKHKPTFTPHMDCGDNVIVINAEKIALTGKKLEQKRFYWHTGYPGGIKEISPKTQLRGSFPERLVKRAVERMISRNVLGKQQASNLRVYNGPEHPHAGVQPIVLDLAAKNRKNVRKEA